MAAAAATGPGSTAPSLSEVMGAIKANGGTLVGESFSQDKYTHMAPGHEGGFCEGICMDWMRRVLNSGRATILDNPGATPPVVIPGTNTVVIPADLKNARRTSTEAQAERDKRNLLRMHGIHSQMADARASATASLNSELTEAQRAEIAQKTKNVLVWDAVKDSLDAQPEGRRPKNKSFTRLNLVKGGEDANYTEVRTFLANMFQTSGILQRKQTAVLLRLHWGVPSSAPSGHGMVVYHLNTGGFGLFDPTVGYFTFQDRAHLETVIDYMVSVVYGHKWGAFRAAAYLRFEGPATTA